MKQTGKVLLIVVATLLFAATGWSQAIFANLSGVVADPSGARIPGVKVTLSNAASGISRVTTTDNEGYYTFASVAAGTYNLVVAQPGFQTFKENGIALGGGEARNVNASLQLGSANQTVEVSGGADIIEPVDSGERSMVLGTQQLQNYVQVGSNAAEYLKIMPGFAIQNGVSNAQNYSGQVMGINANGSAGSQSPLNNAFSYNGLPGNTLDIVSDGAHVSDPGCNCDTPVNPNSDFLQEFRVLASNFNAEDQKGPMVITSVTKAGGTAFHGSAFFTARNYTLNSNDAYAKALGIQRPQDVFYYPGGSIGGPVLIPGTNFNKNRSKLFFFTGFEFFYQVLDTGVLTATVPTPGMITGDFSPSELAKLGTVTASGGPPGTVPASWTGGQMPTSMIDPNMQALMKLYPAPNANPNATGGFNYVQTEIFNQNNSQSVSRVDWSPSDNTKVFVRYNLQRETQLFPTTLWWTPTDDVPYPTPIMGKNRSDSIATTLTHVFSPTLTNETVLAYTFVGFPNVFQDPAKVDRNSVGYKDPTLFNHSKQPVNQIPSYGGDFGPSEVAMVFNPGGFEAGGNSAGLFANKYMPSGSDTLTKVWRTHTLKAGVFYEWIRNSQPANNSTNGQMEFFPSNNPTFTYGDGYADELGGNLTSYSEQNFNRLNEISYNTLEGFVQDAWQVNTKLTIDAGIRLTHFTPWTDDLGYGYSVFIPSQYSSANNGACAQSPTFCGFNWHARDPSVPTTGFPTRALFYQPRLGFAYDLRGSGKTVLSGGWGLFYYHTGQFTAGLDTSAGSEGIGLNPNSIGDHQLLASQLNNVAFTAFPALPTGVDSTDSRQPYAQAYNFTVSQKTPWSGLLELAYVGNLSRDLPSNGGYGSNINLVPIGAMLSAPNPGTANPNNYRPYLGYSDINLVTNNLYSNYNGFQVSWAHQSRGSLLQLNYTWSKAMGIVSGGAATLGASGATNDPFNLGANYGVLGTNRKNLFNAVYSITLPSPIHGNHLAAGVANGWQLSGLTQLQSGANLTGMMGGLTSYQLNGAILPGSQNVVNPGGSNGIPINSQSILGTPDMPLQPILTCNPAANLAPHQFINSNCFAVPTVVGHSGPAVLPAVYGPTYFDSDLGIFKNFQITERTKLQFRVQAQNFLNHPLYSFPNSNNLTLSFHQVSPGSTNFTQTNSNFGYTNYKQGLRIVEFVGRLYF
ncbi:MAG: carboxypeptidase-like regulatory domain-containing protein [Acidobacteriaceae bacterium]